MEETIVAKFLLLQIVSSLLLTSGHLAAAADKEICVYRQTSNERLPPECFDLGYNEDADSSSEVMLDNPEVERRAKTRPDHEQLLTRVMKKDFFELANVNDDDDNGNSGLAKRSSEFFVRSLRSNNGLETDNHNRMRRFGSDYLARSLRSNDGSLTRSMRAGQGSDYLARTMRSRNSKLVRSPPVPNNYLIRAM